MLAASLSLVLVTACSASNEEAFYSILGNELMTSTETTKTLAPGEHLVIIRDRTDSSNSERGYILPEGYILSDIIQRSTYGGYHLIFSNETTVTVAPGELDQFGIPEVRKR